MVDTDILLAKVELYGASTNVTTWTKSYLSERRQRVDYGGAISDLEPVEVGSPQGSVLSPLLFLILTADINEWVSNGSVCSYADDTTCFAAAKTKLEVRQILEKSATEILKFMATTKLAANPTKTKFLSFSKQCEPPIKVGEATIAESNTAELLGVTLNKHLKWNSHLDAIRPELRKRIGLLRRLSWSLPTGLVTSMIDPLFTAKARYAIEIIMDEPTLTALHNLHRQAMKAALRLPRRVEISDKDLWERSGQSPIRMLAQTATANLAWHCMKDWKGHSLTADRIEDHFSTRTTRQNHQQFPPQSVHSSKSLITRMILHWEEIPEELRVINNLPQFKQLYKQLMDSAEHSP
jgi:hypothetical protein